MFSTDQDNGLIPDETRLNVFLRVRGLGPFLRWAVGSTRLVWSSRVKDRIFRINSRSETRFWLGLRIELESPHSLVGWRNWARFLSWCHPPLMCQLSVSSAEVYLSEVLVAPLGRSPVEF